jgi:signal transduction histidine kinase/Tfp pilus assembly protein PilF
VYFIVFKFRKDSLAIIGLVVIALFFGFPSSAQNQVKIDSLKSLLKESSGPGKSDILYQLVIQHANWNNPQALRYAVDGYEHARTIGDTFRIVKGARYKGQYFRRVDSLQLSILSFNEAMAIAKRHRNDKAIFEEYKNSLNGIASTYLYLAEYEKALSYYLTALEIREQENDKGEASIVLNNVGLVYFKLRDYKTALFYYGKSRAYKLESKNYFDLDRLYINIGLCYNQIQRYEEAKKNFNAGFDVCKQNCSNSIKMEGQFGLGVANYFESNFEISLTHLQNSFEIAKETGNTRFQGENLVYMAKVNIKLDRPDESIRILSEAEKLIKEVSYNELLIDIYRQYSIIYNRKEDFRNASVYQHKYITLKDSVYNDDLIGDLAKIQTNFAERENRKTIADKEEIIERQRSLNFSIIIIALLASMLIFVLFRTNRVRKKVNLALSDAKAIIEDQNRQLLNSNYNLDRELKEKNTELQKANESLLRVNDELDNFIYKTSHDIRGPLASLKGMCNVALMDVKDPLALNYLKKLDITAEKLNTILTRLLIVNQINNSALAQDRIDFDTIINDVFLLEKKKGLPARLKIRKNIDPSIEYYSDKEFVRIIFENLIDNAIKFYNDSQRVEPFVDVSVTQEENQIRIRVIDNGIGISEVHPDKIFQMFSRASERSETGGIGLYITKTATEKLGGSVNLKTSPEGYTEFFVLLPLSTSRIMV